MVQYTYDPTDYSVASDPIAGPDWENDHNAQVTSSIVSGTTPLGDSFWRLTAATATSAQGALSFTRDNYADAEVLTLERRTTVTPIIGGAVRIGGNMSGNKDLYAGCIRNNTVDGRIWKWVAGAGTSLIVGPHGLANTVNEWIWVRTKVVGDQIYQKMWLPADPEPANWLLQETDTALTTGHVGRLVFFTNNASADVDLAWWSAGTDADSAPMPSGASEPPWVVNLNTVGSGSITKDPDQADYADDAVVELTAVPDSGWSFDSWSGHLNGTTNPQNLTMDADKSVTATFTEDAPPPPAGVPANLDVVFDRIEAGRVYFEVSADEVSGATQYQAEARMRAGE